MMREYLRNVSLWTGVFSAAAIVETVGLREWGKNPWCVIAVFVVAATVNAATRED